MATKLVIFILVLLMVITAGCGGAPPVLNLFTITVTDNGDPVSGVTVTIDTPFGDVVRETGSDGKATYSPQYQGSYTIIPEKNGYTFDPLSKTVTWNVGHFKIGFEANVDGPGPDLTMIYEDVVLPAFYKAQKAMYDEDDCPGMCYDACRVDDNGVRWCHDEIWPKNIYDEYHDGYINWRFNGTTINDYRVSLDDYTVTINGTTYANIGTSSYDGYVCNGSSLSNNDPIVITGDFEGGTVNVTAFRINFNCRQPTDGTMTIACGVETYTDNDIYLDKRWGTFEYGFYEGGKPCAISCKWATNCNCSNTNDQDQFDYCRCKTLDILAACNSICSRFPGLPFCN